MVLRTDRGLILLVSCLMFWLGGCAGQRAFRSGEDLVRQGKYDQAVQSYATAVQKSPDSHEFRMKLMEARGNAAQHHLQQARQRLAAGDRTAAVEELRLAEGFDPTLETAINERRQIENLLRAEELVGEAEDFYRSRRFQQARAAIDEALNRDPANTAAKELLDKIRQGKRTVVDGQELDVTSDKPINLKFKETDIKDVFNILSKLSGINFILDEEIKTKTFSLLLEDASFPQALEVVLQLNKLGKKVLNPRTIIVYPRTKDKDKQFDDQVIQTFYLSNIDAKKAVNLLRTMLSLRKIYVHEELNALVIRDTPDVIKLAGQVIESADRADSEVVFDLELIEVSHGSDLEFGPKLSSNNLQVGIGNGRPATTTTGGATSTTTNTIGPAVITSFTNLDFLYGVPSATFDLLKKRADGEVLAQPKVRVKNKEKAKVHVGTKEPVITATTVNQTTTENIQYVDVGVKLDIEPTIQLDNTVLTKLSLEVSDVSDRQKTNLGSIALTITTTSAQTALTLKDGEQTVIGGLIRDTASKSRTSIPILGDLPLIGDLLSSHTRSEKKRELLLSITPHIVKNVVMPLPTEAAIWSGGEDDLKAGPAFGTFSGSFDPQTDRQPQPLVPALEKRAPVMPAEEPQPAADAVEEAAPEMVEPPAEGVFDVSAAATDPTAVAEGAAPPSPAAEVPPTAGAQPSLPPEAGVVVPEPANASPVPPVVASPAGETPPGGLVQLPSFEIPAAGDGQLSIAGPQVAVIGQELLLEATIQGGAGIVSAPLFVSYDAERLEFVRAEEGDFLKQAGSTVFVVSPAPGRGQLIVGYKQGVGGRGVSGDGTLFRLLFKPRAAGSAKVVLERLNFRNVSGQMLNVSAQPFNVEIR